MLPRNFAAIFTVLMFMALTLFPTSVQPVNAAAQAEEAFHAGAVYKFVFLSVLEGLYTDNVPNEIVDRIIPPSEAGALPNIHEHFVYGCPLCSPTFYAFLTYRQRPPVPFLKNLEPVYDLEQTSLDNDFMERLASSDRKVRMAALQELINSWIARGMEASTLSASEKAALAEGIRKGRERGMGLLKQSKDSNSKMNRCAVCEGAFEASSFLLDLPKK